MALSLSLLQASPEGNASSSVRVVVYEDLQCSDCAVYRKMLDEVLLPKYGNRVAFEHRDFPLPKHAWARNAAIAARYFDSVAPSLGVAYRRHLFAEQAKIAPDQFLTDVQEFAKAHHAEFDPKFLNEAKWKDAVEEDYQDGIARGVARTPTVFVNGQPFVETFTSEEISKGIDAALAAVSKH